MINIINIDKIEILKQTLLDGNLVLVPTETVYGLAANALDSNAVKNIFQAKGRPQDNPLIIHVHDKESIYKYSQNQPDYLDRLIDNFSPGPLTYVLEKSNMVPEIVTPNLNSVGIRIPKHKNLLKLLEIIDLPLAAPSANRSGRPSATSLEQAIEEFENSEYVNFALQGDVSEVGIESTVIKCEKDLVTILRHGTITKADLENVIDVNVIYYNSEKIESPGQKYKHYSPNIEIILIDNFENIDRDRYILAEYNSKNYLNISEGNLYRFFREAEKSNKAIAIKLTEDLKDNLALYDRIKRASKN
jgi:L-threonylcarbamoyladenylate synthase